MQVTIETTLENIQDAELSETELLEAAENALDGSEPELPGFNVDIVILDEALHTMVKVEATEGEMGDCGFDEDSLRFAVLEALNDADPELPGYNVELTVAEEREA